MDKYNYCHIAEKTDVGCKRSQNEDWLTHFDCENGRISVVCDGMGGHVGGREASHTAIDAIQQFCSANFYEDPRALIVAAIDFANKQILAKTAQHPELNGMGSTCVMLVIRDGLVYIGSVGDSRVYIIRDKTIRQLTKDQSYVQMLVDSGNLSPEEAEHHPRKNEILNALGIPDMKPATVLPDAIVPAAGDCYLLCSDGLSGMVNDNKILNIVSQQSTLSSQERVDLLIAEARKNGGLDNITAQIVEFSVSPSVVDSANGNGKGAKNPKRFIIPAVILLVLAAIAFAGMKFLPLLRNGDAVARQTVDMKTYTIITSDTVWFFPDEGEIYYKLQDKSHRIDLDEKFFMDSVKFIPDKYTKTGKSYIFYAGQVDITIGTDKAVYQIRFIVNETLLDEDALELLKNQDNTAAEKAASAVQQPQKAGKSENANVSEKSEEPEKVKVNENGKMTEKSEEPETGKESENSEQTNG